MPVTRRTARPRSDRRQLGTLGVISVAVICAHLLVASPLAASPLTGGFSPTIVGGGADLNGNGVVSTDDDANAFYGDTSIINGMLDCDAWGFVANQGDAGSGVIDGADDCSLVGYDGTPDGVTIEVANGVFQVADGPLPTVFNAAQPSNPDVGDSDFAWSARDGRVDSNGDETISWEDCHFDLVGTVDILGNLATNECGFTTPPNTADNGLVDRNGDSDITSADSCSNGCFFGLDLLLGKVQEAECPGFEGDSRNDVIGTGGPDDLSGTSGRDIICGLGGNDVLRGRGGNDLLVGGGGADEALGGSGADEARGGAGRDELRGGNGGDTLLGQDGRDSLFGQKGPDLLNGGAGNDSCNGGKGNDTLRSC